MNRTLNILVVDDDADNASSLGELFTLEGHSVSVVHSGRDAIRAYVDTTYDVAFMDVMMPGMNGVESFLEICKLRPEARVYMMTGYSVEELLQQALRGGALGVLEKPFDAREVLRLSASVGDGIVIADPVHGQGRIGEAIQRAFADKGMHSRLVSRRKDIPASIAPDEVLVLDAPMCVIDGVLAYQAVHRAGHRATTLIVPHKPVAGTGADPPFRDVSVTGVLNKPFDPLLLLARLPELAA